MRMWAEVIFNIDYLLIVWSMVALMTAEFVQVSPQNRSLAKRVILAFALLALGDTGHVGFRVNH